MKHLVCTTPPEVEPVDIELAMQAMRVDIEELRPEVERLVAASREVIESLTNRAFLTQTWKLIMPTWACSPGFGSSIIMLPRAPLASVTAVRYYPAAGGAQATLDASKYHVITTALPGFIALKTSETFPEIDTRPDAVEVEFVAGATNAATVPESSRELILKLAAHLFENKGVINIGNIVNELPLSWRFLLDLHRVGAAIA